MSLSLRDLLHKFTRGSIPTTLLVGVMSAYTISCADQKGNLDAVLDHTLTPSSSESRTAQQRDPSDSSSARGHADRVKRSAAGYALKAVKAGAAKEQSAQQTQDKPLSRSELLERNREGISGVWREWYKELENLASHELKHERLPDFSWTAPFSESKRSNINKIKELSARLLIELKNPEVEAMRAHYFELRSKIEANREAARRAALDTLDAPDAESASFWESDKEDYRELKRRKEQAIILYQQEQQRLLTRCHDKLLELGIELSSAQVEQLFQMRSGDTMLTLFSTFAQLNLLGDYVTERMLAARGTEDYPHLAQRYYAVYVAIVSLTLSVHRQTYRELQDTHLPRVDKLSERLTEVIGSTQKLIKLEEKRHSALKRKLEHHVERAAASDEDQSSQALIQAELEEAERHIQQLKANLEVQRKAKVGARAYRAHLTKQAEKIKLAARKVERRFKIAFNTYQTVLIGTDQLELIRAGLRDLSNLQKVQVPDMVPLAGEQVTAHLELLSEQFQGDEDGISLQRKLKR